MKRLQVVQDVCFFPRYGLVILLVLRITEFVEIFSKGGTANQTGDQILKSKDLFRLSQKKIKLSQVDHSLAQIAGI